MNLDALFRLHRDLPRQGPGSDRATLEALGALPPLPPSPFGLDLGCGPGKQTLLLARRLGCPILAVDLHRPFLDELESRARDAGLSHLVQTRCADMGRLDIAPGSVDLIWSEGAIYNLGFEQGLRLWRPLLRENGLVMASELTWLTPTPPDEVETFWQQAYPGMGDIAGNCEAAERAGYRVLDARPLPSAEWWPDYYAPLEERCRMLAEDPMPGLADAIAAARAEIDLLRRFPDAYGYVYYSLKAA
ncbi:class I SAM-dependent methyltransferase [Telmatospirillum sp. J64-1]|uniref:class I SAM-dependent methyltransferase n=1 Tax=Telmatospirillum sp. J64-1 TaxID=2502183 RepID=UPI00115E54BC|nr:class I SAM-dependent methyltransferase [Telmatospirillum sp. J64-1]